MVFCERLVGEQHGWWHACYQAVRDGQADWLAGFLVDADALPWPLGPDDPLFGYKERYVPIAQAMAVCALATLAMQATNSSPHPALPGPPCPLLYRAVLLWQQVYQRGFTAPALPDPELLSRLEAAWSTSALLRQRIPMLLRLLHQAYPDWQLAAVRDVMLSFDRGTLLPGSRSVKVLLPLDLETIGLIATLQLGSLTSGMGQFYPDPQTMAFFDASDAEFRRPCRMHAPMCASATSGRRISMFVGA
ncbi:MAG: hypothetical protein HC837_17140 [Chloroflexaceae bacterium]|nr:hypothetical protein [Chloroflexaceae bacterium]